jgi:hypothetical protein
MKARRPDKELFLTLKDEYVLGIALFAARVTYQPVEERETGPWNYGWVFE